MTKQTIKHLAISNILLGVLLCASLSQAQNKLGERIGIRHPSLPGPNPVIQTAQPGASPSYTYTLFDFPGTFYTIGIALNLGATSPKVEVVGGYGNGALLPNESFLARFSSGKGTTAESYQSVNVPAANGQAAFGVNDAGEMVGQYLDASGVYHGWQLLGTTFTTIDVPFTGATGTIVDGINNSGEIVGGWDGSGVTQHGFTLTGTTFASFDYPGAIQTAANAINNKGDIVGYYDLSDEVEHGFLLSGGTYTSIDPPGSVFTYAAGINDAGDIVGGFCTTSECVETSIGAQGFLLSKGVYTIFTIAGATNTGLQAINDKGVILGGYDDVAGYAHGFLAVP